MSKRRSVTLSDEGLQVVEKARLDKGFGRASRVWYDLAATSLSTLKRFLAQQPITIDCFANLCKAVDINDWEQLKSNAPTSVKASSPSLQNSLYPLKSINGNYDFMMTCTFTESLTEAQRKELTLILKHLGHLLRNCKIKTTLRKNAFAVIGTFTEDKRQQIELTIAQLESILPESTVTVLPEDELLSESELEHKLMELFSLDEGAQAV